MLTRLYCDNYKCLVNFEFRPGPLQLLMGRNGAGKSTIFEVLELLRDFAVRGERCEGRLVDRTRTRWQPEVKQQRFELDVAAANGLYRYELLVDEWSPLTAEPRVLRELVTLDGRHLFLFEEGTVHLHNDQFEQQAQFPFDRRRSGLAIVEPRPENSKLSWFKDWLGRLLCIQIDPKRMGPRADKEAVHPAFDLANFAEWYRHLRLSEGTLTERLRLSLQEIIAGFESLDLKEAGLNTRVLQAAVRAGNAKTWLYAFDELSDGQRALVGLYTLLHYFVEHPGTLCIDEPDNFVALVEIEPWLSRLSEVFDSGLQILIASHHPELLNQLASRNGVVLERVDGRQTLVRPWSPPGDTTLTPAEIVARGWERG